MITTGSKPSRSTSQRRHVLEQRLLVARERQVVHFVLGQHDELREVERVRAFAQHSALRPALAAVAQELADVREVADLRVRRERLRRR